jgi:hypothetical protein
VIGGLLSVLMYLALGACTSSDVPLFTLQVCLGDEDSRGVFVDLLKSHARDEKLDFRDISSEKQIEINHVSKKLNTATGKALIQPIEHLIFIGLEREPANSEEVFATNLGLPDNEPVVYFSAGRNVVRARRSADSLARELRNRWPVQVVPQGTGAKAMTECRTLVK